MYGKAMVFCVVLLLSSCGDGGGSGAAEVLGGLEGGITLQVEQADAIALRRQVRLQPVHLLGKSVG